MKTFLRTVSYVIIGVLIGAGAILPGISGGVLAVVFKIYKPLMDFLTSPKTGFVKYWKMFLPVIAGWGVGFIYGSKLVSFVFDFNENFALSLFIGLILGTVPSLWKEAGKEGRGNFAYIALAVSFAVMTGFLVYARIGKFIEMRPSFFAFVFCGALWGLSLIIPGLTSSSILMSIGLFDPMTTGISSIDFKVLLPWLVGMAATVLLLARVVSKMFDKHYNIAFHAVFGIVLASTVATIPVHFTGTGEFFLCLAALVGGALLSFMFEFVQKKVVTDS